MNDTFRDADACAIEMGEPQDAQAGTGLGDKAVRARYSALMPVIAEHEGQPGSVALWSIGRLCVLCAKARKAPEDLTQTDIDRIGPEMTSNKRKGLRKTVDFSIRWPISLMRSLNCANFFHLNHCSPRSVLLGTTHGLGGAARRLSRASNSRGR
ncbi:hypothetical protein PL335_16725 (plasmid) [Sulfitobacter faviae]|uniref:hypothetical protein n=1 Tax=Sulfitobacter faviae TaxID=1775881 RepID=UPI0023072435|nr:hypothetical protein [Sulfitobacter faviae]WCE68620.1 hypothetical protein PL335_16725 [Sulfitobacter faviae]